MLEQLAPLGVPVLAGVPFGHVEGSLTVPLGVDAVLDTAELRTAISGGVVRTSVIRAGDRSRPPVDDRHRDQPRAATTTPAPRQQAPRPALRRTNRQPHQPPPGSALGAERAISTG
ncbi:hypothetical protein FHX46_001435 [Amycolatopsis viridis]|uniref:LD-carboxypeptidase C-terminal domain-containing protein n=2 Tax=Amycolatopsis viridis TaxID=185678 RepID=A0ABX0SU62_9PSEU|nr:hypothetical protein [Amycolatopsis viridis]NIH78905.1 hypothetical protein [Amycolatopsis viridis]